MVLRHVKTGETMEAVIREDGAVITSIVSNDPADLASDFKITRCTREERGVCIGAVREPYWPQPGKAASFWTPITEPLVVLR